MKLRVLTACTHLHIHTQRDVSETADEPEGVLTDPSMGLNDHRLKNTRCSSVGELRPTEGRGPIFADKQSQVAVFIVAAVRKILTLHDLLHNVIRINTGVVHTAGLPLHGVLLPPGGPVGHEGCCRGWRGSLWFGGSSMSMWRSGGGGRWLGSVG